ncbi:unnamed protein product [Urochloa decumbens]|uniref:BHLH domain-containing protein n=1 Tax=Urochloa decumbens TaxID=240449 RepID=A0ABC8WAP1_9POAL
MAAAGGPFPLELSLDAVGAAAAAAAAAAEAERRRQHERAGQRRRHRRVTTLYAELAAMLPNLPTTRRPASKEKIVEAAAARVTALEGLAAALEARRRAGRGEVVDVSSRATVTVTARMPAPAQAGLLRRVVEAFERRGARVLAAAMARHGGGGGGGEGGVVVTVTAADAAPGVVEMIRADIARIS